MQQIVRKKPRRLRTRLLPIVPLFFFMSMIFSLTAVNLTNSTIGSSGITFLSVSAGTTDIGIVLNNTGSGDFTITGSGTTNGSGGTLQNLNDHGIELINAQDVSLSNMNLTNAALTQEVAPNISTCTNEANGSNTGCNAPVQMVNAGNISLTNLTINGSVQHGINGNNVNGLTISNTDVSNIGNENKENGMHFINLLGTVSFSNVIVDGSDTRNVLIENNTGTVNITVTNSTFDNAGSEVGLDFLGSSTADITFSVTDSSFTHNNSVQLNAPAEDSSIIDATITGNNFDGDPAVTGNSGVDLAAIDTGTLTFDVIGTVANPQTFQPFRSHAINVFASGGGTASGRVNGNTITGSSFGAGISAVAQVTDFNGFNPSITIETDGNDISGVQGAGLAGIHIEASDGNSTVTGTANVDATVNNNTVSTNGADAAIQVYVNDLLAPRDNRACVNVTNNNTTAVGGIFGPTDFFYGNDPVDGSDTGIALMQGFVTNVATTWTNNGNVDSGGFVGTGVNPITGGGTCATVALLSDTATGVNAQPVAKTTAVTKPATGAEPASPTGASGFVILVGTLPAGKELTLTFAATIDDPFPESATQVSNQAQMSADGGLILFSDDPDTGAANDATVTPVLIVEIFLTYLPVVMNNYANLPDLVVNSVDVSGGNITITIENIGSAAVTEDFWVDAYIDPDPVPTAVNQTWPFLAGEGLVWGVTTPLLPGETLTMTLFDLFYDASLSSFSGTVVPGTAVYAQVDSANATTTYGAILENHELSGDPYNNINSTIATSFVFVSEGGAKTAVPDVDLPAR